MAEERYNLKNPGVKRILQEVKELQSNPSDDYMSMPLEDNIFEWQFAIRGPKDSEFEGGVYHGRIQLPAEYPFKPPAFMLLTPNGRFETQTKICLSISAHHPEHWQPSWSVRTALTALIAFMPTKPEGALGSLEYTKEERRALAIKSRDAAPKFGNEDRQRLMDEIHAYMLSKVHSVPPPEPRQTDIALVAQAQVDAAVASALPEQDAANAVDEQHEQQQQQQATPSQLAAAEALTAPPPLSTRYTPGDYGLTLLATGLLVAILALLAKKLLRLYWYSQI